MMVDCRCVLFSFYCFSSLPAGKHPDQRDSGDVGRRTAAGLQQFTGELPLNDTRLRCGAAQAQEAISSSSNVLMSFFQINLNISVGEEQVLVNDIPVELSGVTRLNCQALLCEFRHIANFYVWQ